MVMSPDVNFLFFKNHSNSITVLFSNSHFFSVEDDALCPLPGSCCRQMGRISVSGDTFEGFPTVQVPP